MPPFGQISLNIMLDVPNVVSERIRRWKSSSEYSCERTHSHSRWKLVEAVEYNRVRLEEAVIYVYVSISASTRSR